MTALLRLMTALGPLAFCAVLLWGFLAVREVWRGWFGGGDKISGSRVSLVEEIKAVSKLKVLRVVDAGLDTYPERTEVEARKIGYVDYQYSGMTDLYVDLSKAIIQTNGVNGYVVELAGIERSPVRAITLDRGWEIGDGEKIAYEEYRKFYGTAERQTALLNSLSQYQSASVGKAALSTEYVERAKSQAERMLRYLFTPLVSDPAQDVVIRWRESVVRH